MSGIFISYRRDDSATSVGRLYDQLANHFGHDHIFMDIDHIKPGEDSAEVLKKKLATVDIAIVLIGTKWLSLTDSDGTRCLDNPNDLVRLEILETLKQRIQIIPVVVDGATMPESLDLPDSLIPLIHRNFFKISDNSFNSDGDTLIKILEKSLVSLGSPIAKTAAKKPYTNIPLVMTVLSLILSIVLLSLLD